MAANNVLNQFCEDFRKLGKGIIDLADDVYSSSELCRQDAKALGDWVRMARGPLLTAERILLRIIEKSQRGGANE